MVSSLSRSHAGSSGEKSEPTMSAPYIGGSPYWMFFQKAASIVAESPSAAAFAQRGPCCLSARSAASWNCFSFIFFFSMISTCSRARQRTGPTEHRGKMPHSGAVLLRRQM